MKSAQEEQQLPGDRSGCRLGGAHHQAPGEPFGGVGEGGLGIPGKFYSKNTAEFRGIPYVFQKIPYSAGSKKYTSVDTLHVSEWGWGGGGGVKKKGFYQNNIKGS
jgi:hypothetical protein